MTESLRIYWEARQILGFSWQKVSLKGVHHNSELWNKAMNVLSKKSQLGDPWSCTATQGNLFLLSIRKALWECVMSHCVRCSIMSVMDFHRSIVSAYGHKGTTEVFHYIHRSITSAMLLINPLCLQWFVAIPLCPKGI